MEGAKKVISETHDKQFAQSDHTTRLKPHIRNNTAESFGAKELSNHIFHTQYNIQTKESFHNFFKMTNNLRYAKTKVTYKSNNGY